MKKRMLIGLDLFNSNKRTYCFNFEIAGLGVCGELNLLKLPIEVEFLWDKNWIEITKSPAAHWNEIEKQIIQTFQVIYGPLVVEHEPMIKRLMCGVSWGIFGRLN